MTQPETRIFRSVEDLSSAVGEALGVSDWYLISQERIDAFADATGDHQFIHVDPVRAAQTPMGGTIAHGYYTLSLAPLLASNLWKVENVKMALNYGCNKVRFTSPVRSGKRIRARLTLKEVHPSKGGTRVINEVKFEIEGEEKPACLAETVTLLLV